MKEMDFNEMGPISITAFLKEMRDFCESIGIQEVVALTMLSYFIKKQATLSLEARLLAKKIRATGPHIERLSSYVEVVNFSWRTMLSMTSLPEKSRRKFLQASGVSASLNAKKLHSKALRYGLVYEENLVKLLLFEGSDELMSDSMRVYLGKQ